MTWTSTLAVTAYREWIETTRPSCSQHAGKVMGRVAFVMKLKVFSPKARVSSTEFSKVVVTTRWALGPNTASALIEQAEVKFNFVRGPQIILGLKGTRRVRFVGFEIITTAR